MAPLRAAHLAGGHEGWGRNGRGQADNRDRAAPAGRNLTDADKFEAMIRKAGADLIIHGHNHVGSVAHIEGPDGWVPVIGAPSASARGGALTHRAGYHLYTISGEPGAFQVEAELRGIDAAGRFCGLGPITMGRDPVTFRQVMAMR